MAGRSAPAAAEADRHAFKNDNILIYQHFSETTTPLHLQLLTLLRTTSIQSFKHPLIHRIASKLWLPANVFTPAEGAGHAGDEAIGAVEVVEDGDLSKEARRKEAFQERHQAQRPKKHHHQDQYKKS